MDTFSISLVHKKIFPILMLSWKISRIKVLKSESAALTAFYVIQLCWFSHFLPNLSDLSLDRWKFFHTKLGETFCVV